MTSPDEPAAVDRHIWLDSDAGPVVRPYAVTRGRSRPQVGEFDLLTFVVATPGGQPPATLPPEQRSILARASEPVSVAELASHLDLALGVVRVLLGDLVQDGLIRIHTPAAGAKQPTEHLLEAVINGLRAL